MMNKCVVNTSSMSAAAQLARKNEHVIKIIMNVMRQRVVKNM
jgi:hypothetical protein